MFLSVESCLALYAKDASLHFGKALCFRKAGESESDNVATVCPPRHGACILLYW